MEGWTLTDKRTEGAIETFSGVYLHEPRACTKCGGMALYRHGTKLTTYADAPLRGFAAKLEATVRRYRCRDCGETFLQPLGGVLDERRMTERCAEFIARASLKHTFVHVAREVGVDEKTVRAVAAERMAELSTQHQPRLPCRAEDMHLVTLPPVTRGQRARRALVCDLCEPRFNTETLKAHRKLSTR
jgi:transposase